jgi:hypothetical protein
VTAFAAIAALLLSAGFERAALVANRFSRDPLFRCFGTTASLLCCV